MSLRNLIFGITSAAVGLGIALFIAELVVRAGSLSTPLAYLPNPLYGWSHYPGLEYVRETEGQLVNIKINSQGLRDFEYAYKKPEGTRRILVLGDSFMEALQVDLENSFAKLLERRLNSAATNGTVRTEILNAGTSGYGTDNELLFLRHEGLRYEPDFVLLALYVGNDVRNNWHPLELIDTGGARKPYFTPSGDGLEIHSYPFEAHRSFSTRIKIFLNRHVRLYSLFRETRDRLRHRANQRTDGGNGEAIGLDTYLFQTEYSDDWNMAWTVTKRILNEVQQEANAHGAQLIVVLIPAYFQVHERYWAEIIDNSPAMRDLSWDLDKPNRILTEFLTDNRIPFVDLLGEFREHAEVSGQEYYLTLDRHWNKAGHALAADVVAEAMNARLLAK